MEHYKYQLLVLVKGVGVVGGTEPEVDTLAVVHVVAKQGGVGGQELPSALTLQDSTYLCQRPDLPSPLGHDRFHLARNLLEQRPAISTNSLGGKETYPASAERGRFLRCSNLPMRGAFMVSCVMVRALSV